MKEIAVAAVTAMVAGAAFGGALKLPEMMPTTAPDAQTMGSEDPNMALHRIVMGSDPWTAPPPVVRSRTPAVQDVAYTVDDDADLAAWARQSHADNEAARADYEHDAQAYAYTPVISKAAQPSAAQTAAAPSNVVPGPAIDLVSLDSAGPRG